jgi:hypothetical protein
MPYLGGVRAARCELTARNAFTRGDVDKHMKKLARSEHALVCAASGGCSVPRTFGARSIALK